MMQLLLLTKVEKERERERKRERKRKTQNALVVKLHQNDESNPHKEKENNAFKLCTVKCIKIP